MSFRGGRGGGGGGNSFLKSLPFGLDYSDVSTYDTTDIPSIPLPVNNPISSKDRSLAVRYIKLGQVIRDGPFYTGAITLATDDTSGETDGRKGKKTLIEEEGRKDGIERYSDRFLKKRKIGASIDDHPFHLEVFPKELFSVMGINKKKLLSISKFDNTDNIFTGGAQDENAAMNMLEKLKALAEDEDDEAAKDEEGGKEEEAIDEDFEEDEDDDDDYNAEKYFNDGDDDDYGGEEDYGDEPAF
ncbi:hypothetical protein HG536_0D02850 [Torulaspora globosa]|uniref:DNA-directed RNA polymerase III subunit n=1 Tax=Torulaspora globosa TaxID=48254 RepID=A0A7G3ZGX7_9SACH|nr:uncharacterized protein HG536_0D02850 [Torulaspora globosa]QLL32763.1 hypothetical protein HG536_0D02850 [Torulaspora globosa]